MQFRAIARPYAKALFEKALAMNKLSEYAQAVGVLVEVAQHPEMAPLLKQAGVPSALLLGIFEKMAQSVLDPVLQRFLGRVAQAGRLRVLPDIQDLYQEYIFAHMQKRVVKVISAFALSPTEKELLLTKLQKRFNQELEVTYAIDESLIGGFCIESNGQVIDASVRGRTRSLAEELLKTA